jgi:hypothetical protein
VAESSSPGDLPHPNAPIRGISRFTGRIPVPP